jgi:hypothetical protein
LAIGRSVEMFAVLLRAAAQTLYKSGYKDSKNPGGNLSARPTRRYQYKRLASGSAEDRVLGDYKARPARPAGGGTPETVKHYPLYPPGTGQASNHRVHVLM